MKRRAVVFYQEHRDLVNTLFYFLIGGSVYLVIVLLTPFGIPCFTYEITGLCCPGCGISRFFIELAHLRFLSAARQNLAVAIMLPIWLTIGIIEFWWNPKALARSSKLTDILTWGSVVILVLFGIIRNLPGFEFLLPTV